MVPVPGANQSCIRIYQGRAVTDFARCQTRYCPIKEHCLRWTSPPWEADASQLYLTRLNPTDCDAFVDNGETMHHDRIDELMEEVLVAWRNGDQEKSLAALSLMPPRAAALVALDVASRLDTDDIHLLRRELRKKVVDEPTE